MTTLHPEVVAELEAASAARRIKTENASAQTRSKAGSIGSKLRWRADQCPYIGRATEVFLEAFKLYTTANIEPLIDRVAKLEAKAGSEIFGCLQAGPFMIPPKNLLLPNLPDSAEYKA
jgi:hypothetical protein